MQKLPSWTLLLVATTVMMGCMGSQTDEGAQETERADSAWVSADTVVSDSASALPPRTARVQGEVLSCQGEEPTRCEIRIDKVLGYGMSTPPIAPGTRTVSVRPVVLQNRSISDLVGHGPQGLSLQHAGEQLRLGDQPEPATDWALTEVVK